VARDQPLVVESPSELESIQGTQRKRGTNEKGGRSALLLSGGTNGIEISRLYRELAAAAVHGWAPLALIHAVQRSACSTARIQALAIN
jgi:hypothetical protein